MCKQIRNDEIPERIKGMIDRYVSHGCSPGSCVTAILSNDLMAAFGRADEEVFDRMFDIVKYIYNKIPATCWGSPKTVAEWIASGGMAGRRETWKSTKEVIRNEG